MILTKKKMYPKTDMLNISNIKKGGFHMKKNRKIFSILLVLVLAIQLTAIPAAAASTRTVSRTSTKVTTSYTERKLKLTKKASKTYSVVGKSVTYITYSTQGNTSIKTTKKKTPTMNYKKKSIYCTEKIKTVTTSQLVMAEVIGVEDASDENISVTYRYNIAGKEYESNKVQHLKKIKNGDKEEIRVKKDSPEVILEYNDIIFVIFCDIMLGFCLGLTVVFYLYEMANCMLPSEVEEAGVKTYTQDEILKIANKLLADNRKNENADDVDKNPYAAGVHDGILDVLTNLKIDSKEKIKHTINIQKKLED